MTHFLMIARLIGVLASVCFLLSGCSYEVLHYSSKNNRTYAANDASVSSIPVSGIHRVESGETLFSIAFRYGLDYRELAQTNRIDSPYVIYPKQKIRLNAIALPTPKVVKNTIAPAPIPVPVVKEVPIKVVAPKPVIVIETVKKPPENDIKDQKMSSGWSWPVDGAVTRGFSNTGVSSKGIDIKAARGELVKAAADGTVVYAGSGLIGYGNLVIVKHNDVYLSAYAYNERILVKEKQNVRAGDSLAVIGGKGEERPLLHFEVRRDGQPIDPLKVLPKIK